MCQSAQPLYYAVSGMTNIQTANTNLDGSGTLNPLIQGSSKGTIIKNITIKAAGSNAQGMIRFFIKDSNQSIFLWKEIPVPANVQSATFTAYQTVVRASYILSPSDALLVSTQNAENWNIIVEGVSWDNCPCPKELP